MTYSDPARAAARRTRRPLAALAVVAVIVAGCGDAPADTDTGGDANASGRDQAVEFAECMRENGVTEFPDPDASGELTIDGVVNGSSLNTRTATWRAAIAACKELQPAGFAGRTRSAEQQEAALEFAQCMRDNGQEDFPDPAPDGPLVSVDGARSIPGFDAAMQTCGVTFSSRLGLRPR